MFQSTYERSDLRGIATAHSSQIHKYTNIQTHKLYSHSGEKSNRYNQCDCASSRPSALKTKIISGEKSTCKRFELRTIFKCKNVNTQIHNTITMARLRISRSEKVLRKIWNVKF